MFPEGRSIAFAYLLVGVDSVGDWIIGLPNPLVVGRLKGVRSNGGSLGHRFNPKRVDISPHVMVASLSNVVPVLSIEFVNDLQHGSQQAVKRGLLYVAGESLRSSSTGGSRTEGAECVGFFDDPHSLGVVSVGPI